MSEEPTAVAIEQLKRFGLSTYAARTFIALVSLGTATATEIARVADVPRTRVYDAIDELSERGLVDIQESTPKEFWAISTETAGQKFERQREYRITTLLEALDQLESEPTREKQHGVWTVNGAESITDRVLEFIDDADDQIVYMTIDELLTAEIITALCEAASRDVSIKLAGISPEVQQQLQEEIPEAELFESLWLWSDTPAGRLLMTDETKTLVSVRPDDQQTETAIWGAGETNSLVVVLRSIITWRISEDRP